MKMYILLRIFIVLCTAIYLTYVSSVVLANENVDHSDHDHSAHETEQCDADDHAGHDHSAHETEQCDTDDHAGHDHAEHEGEECATDDHAGHDHAEHSESNTIELSPEIIQELNITTKSAHSGVIAKTFSFPGVITVNDDHLAHIRSRVPGTIVKVNARLGDTVKKGDVLAVLDSRELADAKSDYLAAVEKLALEESNFTREENMFKKQISSERDFFNARQLFAEAKINARSARQKLIALGLSSNDIATIPNQPYEQLTRYSITAPFDGTIIEKHITLGETRHEDEEDASFTIADLSTVWVILQIFPADLSDIQCGDHVTVSAGENISAITGEIDYISPIINAETRTAEARVVISNKNGMYRPGLYITAEVASDTEKIRLCIDADALQDIDGEAHVFVKTAHGFAPRMVRTGKKDRDYIEIISGLKPGEIYVSSGAFNLKAHMLTQNMDPHAGHGH